MAQQISSKVELVFQADQVTTGEPVEQVWEVVDILNTHLADAVTGVGFSVHLVVDEEPEISVEEIVDE